MLRIRLRSRFHPPAVLHEIHKFASTSTLTTNSNTANKNKNVIKNLSRRTWKTVWNSDHQTNLDIQPSIIKPKPKRKLTTKIIKPIGPLLETISQPSTSVLDHQHRDDSKSSDLKRFDQFVTIGIPPSKNLGLYDRKVARFVLESRLKFPHAILLTCVGSFYEAYFDQAIDLCEFLNLKQAKYRFAGVDYPFSGFPIGSLSKHLKTLVQDHQQTVVIADQIPSSSGFERQIVKVITPGTILDEDLIENESNNFLCAIGSQDLAWIDISTGIYRSTEWNGEEDDLMDQLLRIGPKEIVIDEDVTQFRLPTEGLRIFKTPVLISRVKIDKMKRPEKKKIEASELINEYISQNLLPLTICLTKPIGIQFSKSMKLDLEALEGLEILVSQNGKSKAGSLLSTISSTITKPGQRLLRDRLTMPSTVISEIENRLDRVEELVNDRHTCEDLQDQLSNLSEIDFERLLQRIFLSKASVGDLLSLRKVLRTIERIQGLSIGSDLMIPLGLIQKLESVIGLDESKAGVEEVTVDDEGEEEEEEERNMFSTRRFDWNVRPQHSKRLRDLHDQLERAIKDGKVLQDHYRTEWGDPDLRLRTIPRLGAVVEVRKRRVGGEREKLMKKLKEHFSSSEGFKLTENGSKLIIITPEWMNLYALIEELKSKIRQVEDQTIQKLCQQIISDHVKLKSSFDMLSDLDVFQSLATYAIQNRCVRPSLHNEKSTVLIDGRHPIAEKALLNLSGSSFQPNSVTMKEEDGLCQVITGPNNGGKSTYLRQVAIAHVLAQAGSFVPATRAELGIVNRIMTRFGSYDNLVNGKGTFLIEMEEMAKILREADSSSLVLMDEVGRGTANEDGLAIAFGILKFLVNRIGCRSLFATHLHRLVTYLNENEEQDYETKVGKIGFFCIGHQPSTVEEDQPMIYFPHRVIRGVNPNSRGIDVAKMAGLPLEVISLAEKLKKEL